MTTRITLARTAVPFALAMSLLVTACGAPPSSDSGGSVLPPVAVRISGVGSPSGDLAAGGEAAPATAGTSDELARMSMIAPWVVYDFVVGPGFPGLPVEANGWQYPSGTTPDFERIAAIAAALGVSGDLVEQSADMGGGWLIGPSDGSAPSLWIAADGQLSWWYSAPYRGDVIVSSSCASPIPGEEAAPTESTSDEGSGGADAAGGETGSTPGDAGGADDPDTRPIDECTVEEPQPPAGILTADQARERAIALLRDFGVDPAGFDVEAHADQWYAWVSAMPRLGGVTSPSGWYFGFGAEGRLDSAGGVLAAPQEVGPYPLVDLDTALARLENSWYGGFRTMPGAAADDLGAPEVLCAEDQPCADEVPTEPEHVQVTLTGVRQDLWWAWDVDGTVWLLPAFTFVADDGSEFLVPAVTDEYLIMGDVVGDPAVEEPAPPAADGTEPGVIGEDEVARLVGLDEAKALALIEEAGWEARIVARDGESFAVTDDYRQDRVNLTIEDGVVASVTLG